MSDPSTARGSDQKDGDDSPGWLYYQNREHQSPLFRIENGRRNPSASRKGFGPMKKGGILNPAICSLLAELGHLDELLIVDAGYPLPSDGHVIDLTLTPGIPRFLDVLRAVAEELVIESIAVATEINEYSPKLYQEILKIVGDVDVDEVPHHEFKEQSLGVKGIIRTAEFTPYANVRILCGSAF
jgi:D-ribose pyranase